MSQMYSVPLEGHVRSSLYLHLLHPDILIPPLLWLVSEAAGGVTGSRFTANLKRSGGPPPRILQ
jgi:hypothetical protein